MAHNKDLFRHVKRGSTDLLGSNTLKEKKCTAKMRMLQRRQLGFASAFAT